MLFDEATLKKLNRLTLVAAQVRAGVMKGERRSTKRGASIEFADYRSYAPGDDLRRLDWNVYARLDRPFIKLFEEEEDLSVTILVDASRSMDWGTEEHNKLNYALHLAAGLGSIALASGDRLAISLLSASKVDQRFGPVRGQAYTPQLLKYLEALSAGGETHLGESLRQAAMTGRRPGLALLISDLFSSDDYLNSFTHLQSRGFEVVVIHLLAPEEIDPPLAGDLSLVDIESGYAQEVSIDAAMRDQYRQRLHAWREQIGASCRKHSIRYLAVDTALPWDKLILQEMRKSGIVK